MWNHLHAQAEVASPRRSVAFGAENTRRTARPPGVRDLRLVTAVCDDDLVPATAYLLTAARLTDADELALRALASPDCVTFDRL